MHAPDIHGEGAVAVVGHTTSPLDGALGVGGITTGPDTNAQVHGALGETGATLGFVVGDGADVLAIDRPCDVVFLPVDAVGVEGVHGGLNGLPGLTIVRGGIALAEVIGLDLVVVATDTLLGDVSAELGRGPENIPSRFRPGHPTA